MVNEEAGMHETQEQAATRAALIMGRCAAVVTWNTDQRCTAVGVGWVLRSDGPGELLAIECR